MPPEVTPQGVGIIGSERVARHACECIALRRDFASIATCFDNVAGYSDVIHHPQTSLIYCAGEVSQPLIRQAIEACKHVVLNSPMWLPASDLRAIAEFAAARKVVAVTHQPRYWLDDFQYARNFSQDKRLGTLLRVRLTIHEQGLPGESFPRGVLRDLGYHLFDQLLVLSNSQPRQVRLWPSTRPDKGLNSGFLAVLDFPNGETAAVELQSQSLLSWRTGWLLDGTSGAYRAGRIYTQTPDGEIVDEPLNKIESAADPFFDALSARLQNPDQPSLLTDLTHAARVMDLIERLEQSVPRA